MKKAEQIAINQTVMAAAKAFNATDMRIVADNRLRTCNARVLESDKYYILRSYRTNVAFIDKSTGILYDLLRYVYGYTPTSAQHINKFAHDYHATSRMTYYPV